MTFRRAIAGTSLLTKRSVPFLVVLAGLAMPAAAEFTIPPYVQNPGTTTMTVMWEADALDEATVTVGREAGTPKAITASTPVTVTFLQNHRDPASPKQTRYVYSVKLTGLSPGTKYTYLVKMGKSTSGASVFETFPEHADTFTFIAYGDSRSRAATHKRLVANFEQYNPAFILHTGDMVSSGESHTQWRTEFFEPLAGLISGIPILGARGNHEGRGEQMDLYLSPPDGTFGYSFDYGTAHFVCLDMKAEPEDVAWADKDLAATTATWRFAFYHYPNFNIGGHASRWGRSTVVPMFRKHGIDLAFSGHSHLYERFYPLAPLQEPKVHPITYVVTGGGGAPSYGTAPNPCLASYAAKPHFLVVNVAGDTVTVEARDMDNALFDSFTIRKRNGTYDREYLAAVMPEEVVTLHNALRGRSMRVEASAVPGLIDPAGVTCSYSGPGIDFAAEVAVSLDEESQAAYVTEPAVWKPNMTSGETDKITFKVRARREFTLDDLDRYGPPLVFACRYKVGKVEGKITYHVDLERAKHAETGWEALGERAPADRQWRYLSFDPLERDSLFPQEKTRFRNVSLPAGLEQWFMPGFDDSKWKTGKTPIGKGLWQRDKTTFKNSSEWGAGEFLLMRTAFDLADVDYDFVRISALMKQGFHVYLNGHKIHTYIWWKDEPHYRPIMLEPDQTRYLVRGTNVLAVYTNVEYRKGETLGQAVVLLEGWKEGDRNK